MYALYPALFVVVVASWLVPIERY